MKLNCVQERVLIITGLPVKVGASGHQALQAPEEAILLVRLLPPGIKEKGIKACNDELRHFPFEIERPRFITNPHNVQSEALWEFSKPGLVDNLLSVPTRDGGLSYLTDGG